MRSYLNVLNQTYEKSKLTSASTQGLTNMYLEEFPQTGNGRPNVAALPMPGFEEWLDFSGSQVRGMLAHKDFIYAVVDDTAYKINPIDKSYTNIGTLLTSANRVEIAAIDDEVIFVEYAYFETDATNSAVWSYKITAATFAQVTQSQFQNPLTAATDYISKVVGFHGHFIYLMQRSKTIYVSDLNDGRTINALSFVTANSFADNIHGMVASKNYLYFFSTHSTEVWWFSGGSGAPIDRVSGGVLQYGILSPDTVEVISDNVYFMATDKNGFLGPAIMNGTMVQVVQKRDLAQKINGYKHNWDKINGSLSAYSWSDALNGHIFFNTTFPNAEDTRGRTWTLDTTTGTWLERQSFNASGALFPTQDIFRAYNHTYINNVSLIGDYYTGKIYQLKEDKYTDDGTAIVREITSPHMMDRDNFFSLYNLEVDVEGGQGLDGSGQGSSPLLIMQVSTDRGNTWSKEIERTASEIGQYRHRVRFGSLGGGRVFTLRFKMSDPIHWSIVNITVEVEREETLHRHPMQFQ